MIRRRLLAPLQTRRGLSAAALVLLAVLAGGGYALAHRTTPVPRVTILEIVAWSHADAWSPGQQPPPDVKVFDKTITTQGLVRTVQDHLNRLQRGDGGGCLLASQTYLYEFRFATNGMTTQTYTGDIACTTWEVVGAGKHSDTVGGAQEGAADVAGENLMNWLHQQIGMPLPSWWSTIVPVN